MTIMTKNIKIVSELSSKLAKSVSNCSTNSLAQAVEMATHIERAFYEMEIDEEQRAEMHKKLDEHVKDFFVKCECKEEIAMTFD